jgi:hypothetical protein
VDCDWLVILSGFTLNVFFNDKRARRVLKKCRAKQPVETPQLKPRCEQSTFGTAELAAKKMPSETKAYLRG